LPRHGCGCGDSRPDPPSAGRIALEQTSWDVPEEIAMSLLDKAVAAVTSVSGQGEGGHHVIIVVAQ
jgi:hypothetical protein